MSDILVNSIAAVSERLSVIEAMLGSDLSKFKADQFAEAQQRILDSNIASKQAEIDKLNETPADTAALAKEQEAATVKAAEVAKQAKIDALNADIEKLKNASNPADPPSSPLPPGATTTVTKTVGAPKVAPPVGRVV